MREMRNNAKRFHDENKKKYQGTLDVMAKEKGIKPKPTIGRDKINAMSNKELAGLLGGQLCPSDCGLKDLAECDLLEKDCVERLLLHPKCWLNALESEQIK